LKEITVNNIAYECSYCDYRFIVKKDCQKHELLTHKIKNKYIEGTYIFWIETNEQAREIAELVLGERHNGCSL
jgi:sulfatase maturation enzyme AslB (radical SAM superfamily)